MDKITPTALAEMAGISMPYASQILSGARAPSRPLAIHILRKTGWRHALLRDLSDEHLAMLETVDPWSPPKAAAA